jgi:hypothetical protein
LKTDEVERATAEATVALLPGAGGHGGAPGAGGLAVALVLDDFPKLGSDPDQAAGRCAAGGIEEDPEDGPESADGKPARWTPTPMRTSSRQ